MQRKVFGAELKAKVALEALAGRKTANEIAGAYEVHPHQVAIWKREAQEGLKALFERQRGQRGQRRVEDGTDLDALYGQIGRLQVQVEWLKKRSGLNPPP
jgi:transposase-like protein